ncbi:hypothetical protein PR048_020183 [Dryococelus australis]|uniref:Uncharacterized protein n=1 Tax=Dryococelus australis TaxID=614101 RepID=A0ABQ9H5L0_9NEOP|nr:hypothetical protein PR048_020183 [Dryococelus australis]
MLTCNIIQGIGAHLETLPQGPMGAEMLAEHTRYFNKHAPVHANTPITTHGKHPVLKFRIYQYIYKMHFVLYTKFEVMLHPVHTYQPNHAEFFTYCYAYYVKVDNDTILASKTISLPKPICTLTTGEWADYTLATTVWVPSPITTGRCMITTTSPVKISWQPAKIATSSITALRDSQSYSFN